MRLGSARIAANDPLSSHSSHRGNTLVSEQHPPAAPQQPAPQFDPPRADPQYPQPYGQQYPPQGVQPPYPPQQPGQGSGLAVAALVVGVLALLTCWIPVVNVIAIIGGIVGLVLAILALNAVKKGRQQGKGLAVAGLVLSVLAVLGGIVVNVAFAVAVNEADEVIQEAAEDAEDAAADDGVAADEEEQVATETDALPLGQSAEVGDYTVTVTAVNLNANDALAQANEFNEPPTNQYVTADISVVYNGSEEGDPWLDLYAVFAGTDARQYDESTCEAATAAPGVDLPTLTKGGTAEYQVCMDVPAEATEGGTLFLEPSFTPAGEGRVTWALQ